MCLKCLTLVDVVHSTIPPTFLRDWARDWVEQKVFSGEISWGPANIPLPLATQNLKWWEENCDQYGLDRDDIHTNYYEARNRNGFQKWLFGSEQTQLAWELQTGEGSVQAVALAILQSSDRARRYWTSIGNPTHELSAYTIALGINGFRATDNVLYTVSGWTAKGSQWDWAEAIKPAADVLGLTISEPADYIRYTDEEKQKLDALP